MKIHIVEQKHTSIRIVFTKTSNILTKTWCGPKLSLLSSCH